MKAEAIRAMIIRGMFTPNQQQTQQSIAIILNIMQIPEIAANYFRKIFRKSLRGDHCEGIEEYEEMRRHRVRVFWVTEGEKIFGVNEQSN